MRISDWSSDVCSSDRIISRLHERHRIDGFAIDTNFIMKVAARRATSRTHQADDLPASYALVRLHNQLGHMTIAGRNAVAMIDFDQIAITSGPSGPADDAVRSGIDRSADWSGNIDALMSAEVTVVGIGMHAIIAGQRNVIDRLARRNGNGGKKSTRLNSRH